MALSISSCVTLNEPDIYMCAIVNGEFAQCVPSNKKNPEFDLKISEMLGFICASPNDFGAIKKHHSELHKRLEDSKK